MSRKSSSVVLLTISVVLAVAVFVFSYLVKPNDESDVLAKARERQAESLISVQQPLETDQNVITKEEEMKNAVYELLLNDKEFTKAIAENISSDSNFTDTVYQSVLPRIDEYLANKVDFYVAEFTPQIEAYVDELYKAEDPTIFVDQLIEPVTIRVYEELDDTLTKEIKETLASDFSSSFLDARTEIENDIYNRVLENLDVVVPEYTEAVKTEVLETIETEAVPLYEQQLKAYIDEQVGLIGEDTVLAVYEKYRDEVVVEVVNEVLLRLDDLVIQEVKAEEPEIQTAEAETIVEEPVKEVVKPISAPTFVGSKTEKNISNDDYIKERTERREAIISDILNKLK